MKNKDLINILTKLPEDALVDIIETDGTYYSRIYKIRYDEEEIYKDNILKKIHLSLEPVWEGAEHINRNDVWVNDDIEVPPHCYTCNKYNHLQNNCEDGRVMDSKCRFYSNEYMEGELLK